MPRALCGRTALSTSRHASTVLRAARGWGPNVPLKYVGPEEVAASVLRLTPDDGIQAAINILRREFVRVDGAGPQRAASYPGLTGEAHDNAAADLAGLSDEFLRLLEAAAE